ncbi:hypothetical protein GE09DRAFT_1172808 [Coniochaeta sp. 2T2.1]|nr:hypothetical protein GE09DRAFT_1172808 [Coniochaeta sp. 2T2.1]
MASQLPAFPRFVFTVFEPISLVAGSVAAVFSPEWFISQQIDQAGNHHAPSTDSNLLVAQQLGNCYLLAFLVALGVLYTTTELAVVRSYLKALWIADITHVALTFYALGYDRSVAVADWNATTWGNIGITVFLCMTRTMYLLGVFGPNKPPPATRDKAQ